MKLASRMLTIGHCGCFFTLYTVLKSCQKCKWLTYSVLWSQGVKLRPHLRPMWLCIELAELFRKSARLADRLTPLVKKKQKKTKYYLNYCKYSNWVTDIYLKKKHLRYIMIYFVKLEFEAKWCAVCIANTCQTALCKSTVAYHFMDSSDY